jgi:DNA-binding NtrC family response regulator
MIILLDDDDDLRETLCGALGDAGYAINCYPSAEHAMLDLDRGLVPDLVISDISLGAGMNGLDFGRLVKSIRPHVFVVYITGYSAYAREYRLSDYELMLVKPFSFDKLLEVISRHVGRSGGAGHVPGPGTVSGCSD